ncbi:MAG: SUMF1/EgtB/PvdO family nonheme iron enzyme, partial [Bacteroidota bacterium]|nr:SUMF1/EgtB/PvdO family nonheme iron enzyme [Bacteroidota bacterium]
MKKSILLFFLLAGSGRYVCSQTLLQGIQFSKDSLTIQQFQVRGTQDPTIRQVLPLASFLLEGRQMSTQQPASFRDLLQIQFTDYAKTSYGLTGNISFKNISKDTLRLENVVPFGEGGDRVYITGKGKQELSRTHLFVPGRQPVNVIVPDNAWDLSFCSMDVPSDHLQLTALARRNRASILKGTRTRFETILYPGGSVSYNLYLEAVSGDWHAGLEEVFQKRLLYDLDHFDNSLFERKDLQWVRHAYVSHIMMNWDKDYYDATDKQFHLAEFLAKGKQLFGGDDFICLWPTWPTLGLDQRNQFDLFNDLPGGLPRLSSMARESRAQGTRLFVCYNPWDESTRSENHFEGISKLIAGSSADGVVLDTKGESSKELQAAADKVKPGVIMYSEGMAIPKYMPGIVSGRVHNALYYPPMLNLNKLIKPEFAIFRVAEIYKEPIQREFALAFFNGYGTEMNIMAPGKPDWVDKQYEYLGRTSRILRENTNNFVAHGFTPLIETSADNIWVNQWVLPEKTLYTIYSLHPEGYKDYLFRVTPKDASHFVDLWHHRLLEPARKKDGWWIEAETASFDKKWLGTNNEGEVDAIARLPLLIRANRDGDLLTIHTPIRGDEIRIWAGKPGYDKKPIVVQPGTQQLSLYQKFGRFEGDFIIQLMDKGILLDETIVSLPPGEPRRVSGVVKSKPAVTIPKGMVSIPAGSFHFIPTHGDAFIPYPTQDADSMFSLPSFYMDRFPVTNQQYGQFVKASHYHPADTVNYLKHWINGQIPKGMENYPVVYISYEDAKAYAAWSGKRLPTEIEWQYAAQTTNENPWPWKQTHPVTRKEQVITATLTVSALEGIDSSVCNLGNGALYPVGKYPSGA